MPKFTRALLPGLVSGDGQQLQASPFQFYLTGNERLRLTSWNTAVGATIVLQGRYFREDDTVSEMTFSHVANADRTAKTTYHVQNKSLLTNLVVFVTGAAVRVGQTFVQVSIVVGDSVTPVLLGTVMQGYVTSQQSLAWPGSPITNSLDGGGFIRYVSGTTPAPGNAVTETVPTGARWEVVSVQANFVTSAVVANRRVYFTVGQRNLSLSPATVPATQIIEAHFAQGMPMQVVFDSTYHVAGLLSGFPAIAGTQMIMSAVNLDAGDQFANVVLTVREWLEVA